jgi:hypothetical protein
MLPTEKSMATHGKIHALREQVHDQPMGALKRLSPVVGAMNPQASSRRIMLTLPSYPHQ